ncbi:hypothetical protein [Oceanibium sediminis]|uniref:hypothetical protein n=1 Tax=Oceanibium sediminis TaxID=2026339 RepID=UPI000DD2CA0D|nr:hypothetical protein [Oceanibium sediminis]
MRRIGTLASAVWAGLVVAYGLGYVTTLKPGGVALVLALLGFAAAAAVPVLLLRAILHLSEDLAARDAGIEALHRKVKSLETRLESQDKRLRKAEATLRDLPRQAAPVMHAPAPPRPPEAETTAPPTSEEAAQTQPDLPLEGGANADGDLSLNDTIRALNFPQNAEDNAGFAVLRRALASHDLARLLQASEDCLNLLAHQGIYMDDLIPAPATAEDWRQFAKGGTARAALMPLNGITDGETLATVRAQMRGDPIFRDTALYFQRRFDQLLQSIAPEASDDALLSLVDTRSGRAFVLLVQVSGMSDALRG